MNELYRLNQYKKRTQKSLNEIIVYDDYAKVLLYDKNCNVIESFLIDIEDIDSVKNVKWSLKNDNYYVRNGNVGYIHRYIMNCPDNMVVDHINGNKLDNRKSNLRICTVKQNNYNHKIYKTSKTGYPGVGWHTKSGKWRARIQVDGKEIYLGIYENIEDAINARKTAEEYYFGSFNRCN